MVTRHALKMTCCFKRSPVCAVLTFEIAQRLSVGVENRRLQVRLLLSNTSIAGAGRVVCPGTKEAVIDRVDYVHIVFPDAS